MDAWYMDCRPCGIAVPKGTEDEALILAAAHIAEVHPGSSPQQRTQEYIGHVQLRTMPAAAPPASAPLDGLALTAAGSTSSAAEGAGEGAEQLKLED